MYLVHKCYNNDNNKQTLASYYIVIHIIGYKIKRGIQGIPLWFRARAWYFHCGGNSLIPDHGTKILQPTLCRQNKIDTQVNGTEARAQI